MSTTLNHVGVIENDAFLQDYADRLIKKFPVLAERQEYLLKFLKAPTNGDFKRMFPMGKNQVTDRWNELIAGCDGFPSNRKPYRTRLLDELGVSELDFKNEWERTKDAENRSYPHETAPPVENRLQFLQQSIDRVSQKRSLQDLVAFCDSLDDLEKNYVVSYITKEM